MKFIAIESVRGLEIDQPVFTKDAEGNFGYGRLIEESKTAQGIKRTFEMAVFENDLDKWGENREAMKANKAIPHPELKKIIASNITHVCIPK